MSREELKRLIADDAYAASFQTMGQYRSALLKAIAGRSADRNRPTMAPGGCECAKCGAIFIGGVEHDLCGVCAADSAQDYLDTLAAVLNAIGYTEEFAAAHPDLKVSDGVKLFLAKQRGAIECQAHIGPDCTECGGSGFWDGEQPSARVSLSDDMAARIKNLCASYFIEQGDDFQIGANTVARRVIAILAASAAQGDSNGN